MVFGETACDGVGGRQLAMTFVETACDGIWGDSL